MLEIAPVPFLLWRVKMSAMKRRPNVDCIFKIKSYQITRTEVTWGSWGLMDFLNKSHKQLQALAGFLSTFRIKDLDLEFLSLFTSFFSSFLFISSLYPSFLPSFLAFFAILLCLSFPLFLLSFFLFCFLWCTFTVLGTLVIQISVQLYSCFMSLFVWG